MKEILPPAATEQHPAPNSLERFTPARIGLGTTGSAIPLAEHLRFQLDHALARDAVHTRLNTALLLDGLRQRGMRSIALRSAVHSEATQHDRRTYLRRPDLGRRLDPESRLALETLAVEQPTCVDLAIVIADGLSALAVERHALPLLDSMKASSAFPTWSLAPVCVVTEARVAIGDEIGAILRARLAVVLIGERPGLSAPDSLGIYITWNPQPGRTDAERNCISNVRLAGLPYREAASRILFYLRTAKELQATGVTLKQNTPTLLPWTCEPLEQRNKAQHSSSRAQQNR